MKSITDVSHPDNSQYDSEYILRVHVLVWSNPRSSLPENTARGQPPIPWQTLSPKFREKLYIGQNRRAVGFIDWLAPQRRLTQRPASSAAPTVGAATRRRKGPNK